MVWKKVKGYNYEVSDDGQVRNYKTKKLLKQGVNKSYPYARVSFSLGCSGTPKIMFIHRLVAEAFINNPENKPQVNHIDGNKLNNNVDNLEWVTNKENQIHAWETGLQKITDEQREKMSSTRIRNETSKGKNNPMYGKKFSDEHREKISASLKGKLSGKNNPMYGKNGLGKSIKIKAIYPDGKTKEYVSTHEASKNTGINRSAISKGLRENEGCYKNKKTGIVFYAMDKGI